jgi:hypothetical protein
MTLKMVREREQNIIHQVPLALSSVKDFRLPLGLVREESPGTESEG